MAVTLTIHAQAHMFERGISTADVRAVLETGEVLERFRILGWVHQRPMHVIYYGAADERIVISLSDPSDSPELWTPDFKWRIT